MDPTCTFQDVVRQRLRRLKQLEAAGGPVFRERRRCRDQRFDLVEHVLERFDRDWIDEHAPTLRQAAISIKPPTHGLGATVWLPRREGPSWTVVVSEPGS